jgi:hypothetical protein
MGFAAGHAVMIPVCVCVFHGGNADILNVGGEGPPIGAFQLVALLPRRAARGTAGS